MNTVSNTSASVNETDKERIMREHHYDLATCIPDQPRIFDVSSDIADDDPSLKESACEVISSENEGDSKIMPADDRRWTKDSIVYKWTCLRDSFFRRFRAKIIKPKPYMREQFQLFCKNVTQIGCSECGLPLYPKCCSCPDPQYCACDCSFCPSDCCNEPSIIKKMPSIRDRQICDDNEPRYIKIKRKKDEYFCDNDTRCEKMKDDCCYDGNIRCKNKKVDCYEDVRCTNIKDCCSHEDIICKTMKDNCGHQVIKCKKIKDGCSYEDVRCKKVKECCSHEDIICKKIRDNCGHHVLKCKKIKDGCSHEDVRCQKVKECCSHEDILCKKIRDNCGHQVIKCKKIKDGCGHRVIKCKKIKNDCNNDDVLCKKIKEGCNYEDIRCKKVKDCCSHEDVLCKKIKEGCNYEDIRCKKVKDCCSHEDVLCKKIKEGCNYEDIRCQKLKDCCSHEDVLFKKIKDDGSYEDIRFKKRKNDNDLERFLCKNNYEILEIPPSGRIKKHDCDEFTNRVCGHHGTSTADYVTNESGSRDDISTDSCCREEVQCSGADDAFFASIIPTVRKYNRAEKLVFRMGVLAVMKKINGSRKS